eukprot:7432718-Alexandrium_andersonii.AAC.1
MGGSAAPTHGRIAAGPGATAGVLLCMPLLEALEPRPGGVTFGRSLVAERARAPQSGPPSYSAQGSLPWRLWLGCGGTRRRWCPGGPAWVADAYWPRLLQTS